MAVFWMASDLDGRECGAANRTRTCDPVITNDVLYQLSYCGGPKSSSSENAVSGVPVPAPQDACHLISGNPRFCKIKAPSLSPPGGSRIQPPQRARNPRHPPAWP